MTTFCDVIGESSFLFNFNGIKVLTDPWFGEPIYGGGWSQFPLPVATPEQLTNIKFIFISHVHPDHCCIESISKTLEYSPNAKILMMDRIEGPCYLSKKLSRSFNGTLNSRIVRIKPFKQHILDDLCMWCLPPSSENPLNEMIDSTLVIKAPEGLIFFANDNTPTIEHAQFINTLDCKQYIALLPFSGGSGFPSSYKNLTQLEKSVAAQKTRSEYESYARKFLSATSFDFYMPIAGNHILVSKSYDYHTTTGFLQNPYSVIKKINTSLGSTCGIYVEPGNQILPDMAALNEPKLSEHEIRFEFQKKLFIEAVSSRIKPYIFELDELQTVEIMECFHSFNAPLIKALLNTPSELLEVPPLLVLTSANIYMTITNSSAKIDKLEEAASAFDFIVDTFSSHHSFLCVDVSPILLNAIITKKIHINEADAACFLTYYRTMQYIPDLYTAIFTTII